MARKSTVRFLEFAYSKLLHFYPARFYERFGNSMEQTFRDLCHDRARAGYGFLSFILWMFFETSLAICKENIRVIVMPRKLVRIVVVTGLLLLIPLLGMGFSDEMDWELADFMIAAALLISTGLAIEVFANRSYDVSYRIGGGLAVITALLLIWVNLAVGIIGSEDNPANLLYSGVICMGIIGSLIARFAPSGMARTLFATALVQALVPVVAMAIWRPPFTWGVVGVFALNGFFVLLFLTSAILFRYSNRPVQKHGLSVSVLGSGQD